MSNPNFGKLNLGDQVRAMRRFGASDEIANTWLERNLGAQAEANAAWRAPEPREMRSPEDIFTEAARGSMRSAGTVAPGAAATITEENMPEGPLAKLGLAATIASAPMVLNPVALAKGMAYGAIGTYAGGEAGEAVAEPW